jgi:predicted MFS family arabinose efflux permease
MSIETLAVGIPIFGICAVVGAYIGARLYQRFNHG